MSVQVQYEPLSNGQTVAHVSVTISEYTADITPRALLGFLSGAAIMACNVTWMDVHPRNVMEWYQLHNMDDLRILHYEHHGLGPIYVSPIMDAFNGKTQTEMIECMVSDGGEDRL